MKRLLFLLFLIISFVVIASCSSHTITNETETISQETFGNEPVENDSTVSINTDYITDTETEFTESEETSFYYVGKYKNIQEERPFEGFMLIMGDMGTNKVLLDSDDLNWLNFVEFVVLGIEEKMPSHPFEYCSSYFVIITDVFGKYKEEFQDKIVGEMYRFYYYGSPEKQRYARPSLVIGDRYLAFFGEKGWVRYEEKIFGPSLIMSIGSFGGAEYLYGRNVDLSDIKNAIKITDSKENEVYDEEKQKAQIEELRKLNIPIPKYEYKLDYLDFRNLIETIHNQ
ncbi:MAG: hypothetical protein K6F14_02980 [Clostridiales bacterium]|nr:hypothetical protein [Clostridiales bacterium]